MRVEELAEVGRVIEALMDLMLGSNSQKKGGMEAMEKSEGRMEGSEDSGEALSRHTAIAIVTILT